MRQSRYGFFLSLFFLCFVRTLAQTTYPVQVNTHLLPPYSLYLSDYYSGTREKLTITLINRDQFKPTLSVRLRMIITAPGGIRIQTNENAYIEPVIVETGSPVRLTQDDLAPYFQPNNLITQGYLAAGKMPEGLVEFCFQAVEAYTGQVLSASTCARAWITSQKPPLLSLPRNNESIVFREPLNVLFQWTPLHQGLAQVEYDFILKELWDNGMAPQAAFLYSPEIYRETTRSTSIVYGAMQPPLIPGKRYAWCVRAQAREGMDEVNLFQNDGYSEIRSFLVQDNCLPPEYVLATAGRKKMDVEWNTLPAYIGFTVSYRLKDDATSEWKEMKTLEPTASIQGLKSGATYEYRVAAMCMAGEPVYSPVFTVTLPETDSARLAQCGIMPEVNLANQEPIKELKTSEVIMANDYPVTITRIEGGNGVFTGEGWTVIPWLNDAKLAVQFTSITVNTDKQMIDGYIDAKYDKNEGQIGNLDDVFEGGFDIGTVKTGITKVDHVFDFSIPGVDAFSLNEEGELVITDSEGTPHTINQENLEGQGNEGNKVVVFPMTVQDKDGNIYQVEKVKETDAAGKETAVAKATFLGKAGAPLAAGSFDPSQLDGDKAIVTFHKGGGFYAFDTWEPYYETVSLIKSKYQKLWDGYYAPWKFLPAGETDAVNATIQIIDQSIKPELVIFKTPTGTEYKATFKDGTYTLQVAAGPVNDAQEVYALYPNGTDKYYTLGKLSIATYEPQSYKVVLVPVNNVPVEEGEIRRVLKETYGPVAVTWTVVKDRNFDYIGNTYLMANGTGLSTYNEDMRALNASYKAASGTDFDKAANYLFFLKATGNGTPNKRDLTGFMPRGAQFGYLFTSELEDRVEAAAVAHELGHGRWKFFHTFDGHYGAVNGSDNTENVMDYNNGMHIAKWQWDIMGDPAWLVSVFDGDDGSASYSVVINDKFLNKDKKTFSFVTYNGSIITLEKSKIKSILLNYGTTAFRSTGKQVPGVLQQFTLLEANSNVTYSIDPSDGIYKSGTKFYSDPSVTDDIIDGVIMGLPCGGKFNIYKFEKNNLSRYSAKSSNEAVKDVVTFPLRPFADNKPIYQDGTILTQSIDVGVNQCYFCMDQSTAEMTGPYCQKPEILYITKIAQFRVAYPSDFSAFTSTKSDWANPDVLVTDDGLDNVGAWGEYLDKNNKLIVDFTNGHTEGFFKIMYEKFYTLIDQRIDGSKDFWKNLTEDTLAIAVSRETRKLGRPELEALDFEKRKLAIKILMKGTVIEHLENAVISLIASTKIDERKKLLDFLEDEVKFRKIFKEFDDFMGEDNFTRIITLISSFIEDPATDIESFRQALAPVPEYVNIDLDLLFNKQTDGYYIDDSNFIHFYKEVRQPKSAYDDPRTPSVTRNEDLLVVYYDKKIPVQFWSTFNLVGDKTYHPKQVVVDLPAIYVALLLDKGSTELFSKKAWLLVDGVMLFVGVGEVKILFSGASWVRKAMVAGAIVGSTMGIVVESLPSSAISDPLRNRLRILSAVLTLPEAARALKDLGKGIIKELRASKQNTTVVTEQQKIEDLAVELEKTLGAAESAAGLLSRHDDLRFIYGGLQKNLGGNATRFEKALASCTDEVMAVFNQHPDLLYKLGDIEGVGEAVIKSRLDDIALQGKDFGVFKTAAGNVAGKNNAVLFSGIKNDNTLSGLKSKFDALESDVIKSRFLNDFADAGGDAVRTLNGETDLVDIWKGIKFQSANRGNVNFLQWAKQFKGNDQAFVKLRKHLFEGEQALHSSGQIRGVTGVHHKSAITYHGTGNPVLGDIQIKPGTSPRSIGNNGVYEQAVEIFDGVNWKPKIGNNGNATFFPDNMVHEQILEELALARSKITPADWQSGNTYRTTMSNGDEVDFFIGPQVSTRPASVSGRVISAFPKN